MFTADEIEARLRRQPYTPVRLVIRSGQGYEITHPNLVLISKHSLIIGIPCDDDPSLIEGVNRIAVPEITAMQDLLSPTAT
jgi:hypothetical protein